PTPHPALTTHCLLPLLRHHPRPPLFPYTTLFRSAAAGSPRQYGQPAASAPAATAAPAPTARRIRAPSHRGGRQGTGLTAVPSSRDRKSTRLNSSHVKISYAVFCLKKKNKKLTMIE